MGPVAFVVIAALGARHAVAVPPPAAEAPVTFPFVFTSSVNDKKGRTFLKFDDFDKHCFEFIYNAVGDAHKATLEKVTNKVAPACKSSQDWCEILVEDLWTAVEMKVHTLQKPPSPHASRTYGQWCRKVYEAEGGHPSLSAHIANQGFQPTVSPAEATPVASAVVRQPRKLRATTKTSKQNVEAKMASSPAVSTEPAPAVKVSKSKSPLKVTKSLMKAPLSAPVAPVEGKKPEGDSHPLSTHRCECVKKDFRGHGKTMCTCAGSSTVQNVEEEALKNLTPKDAAGVEGIVVADEVQKIKTLTDQGELDTVDDVMGNALAAATRLRKGVRK